MPLFPPAATSSGTVLVSRADGRLTTESGVPVSTGDRTSQGTLYYTPYVGNQIALYSGAAWAYHTFTERSLAMSVTADKNYDVFLYDNAGTLTLELSDAWTDDATRDDALTTQDGVVVKSGATTRRWLGTIRASGANVIADSRTTRFVSNFYNQVKRPAYTYEGTGHSYNSVERDWRANTSSYCYWIMSSGAFINASMSMRIAMAGSTSNAVGFLNIDGTNRTPILQAYSPTGSGVVSATQTTKISLGLAAGFHYAKAREWEAASVSSTFEEVSISAEVLG